MAKKRSGVDAKGSGEEKGPYISSSPGMHAAGT
jgi:hypothetical protein